MTSTQYVRVEGGSYLTARIWLAAGNPCQVPFEQLDIAL
jgi:hypothetical protein